MIVDIDRHILYEIADITKQKDELRDEIDKHYSLYKNLEIRQKVLLEHIIKEVEKTESRKDSKRREK